MDDHAFGVPVGDHVEDLLQVFRLVGAVTGPATVADVDDRAARSCRTVRCLEPGDQALEGTASGSTQNPIEPGARRFLWRSLIAFRSNAAGFELEAPPGERDLEVTLEWWRRTVVEGVLVRSATRTDLAEIVLADEDGNGSDPGAVRGRLVDEQGRPLSRVEVVLEQLGAHDVTVKASSDDDGRFALEVAPGSYLLRARLYGFAGLDPPPRVEAGGPPLEITIMPLPERAVSGRVMHDGVPVEGSSVRLYVLPDRCVRPPEGTWGAINATDAEGRFTISDIAPSHIGGIVVARSAKFGFARSAELEIPPEGALDGVDVVSVPGFDFELRIALPDGSAAPRAYVKLTGRDEPAFEARGMADETGVWRVAALPPGEYRVLVISDDRAFIGNDTLRWDAAGETKRITLRNAPRRPGDERG